MNAIDTNVLVYTLDHMEPVKRAKAVNLLRRLANSGSDVVVVWQVAAEYTACLRRWENAGRLTARETELFVDQFLAAYPVTVPTVNVIRHSVDLRNRFSLSHWDGMLIAACVEAGVGTLYSEDMDDGANYDGVTVVDPFA